MTRVERQIADGLLARAPAITAMPDRAHCYATWERAPAPRHDRYARRPPPGDLLVNNIRSTLATVWRIAIPYFRSEDKWAGRGLLASVIVIELAVVGLNVLFNRWNNVFYNALQERDYDVFTYQIGYFTVLA
eukprot:gene11229-15020_t